jgi:hypothetical protein
MMTEVNPGHNKLEVLEEVPAYFQIDLKNLKPPGKLVFQSADNSTRA